MTTIEPESPDLVPKNLAVGMRLWAGATTFVFFGPFFAYLYLRSVDSAGRWRPADIAHARFARRHEKEAARRVKRRRHEVRAAVQAWARDGAGFGRLAR